ncbi:acetolactate synthase, small subunit [Abditibacterium utsteinense]|uniref:acetolactate synthase n=1 Tax=Abditibacterium utsteinense TaxID=1960156 RepID=A0A2S8SPA9_9BACT|nr:acetolactate synthase small subunit [Abditibacterium utsteinense]PQV62633.1 acetolactate synthase, small subunit [Abditibacterium utsteinense]
MSQENGTINSNVPAQSEGVVMENGVPTIIAAAGVNTMNSESKLHTISILVENSPGVLARVSHVFARRGFNLESLAVSRTEDVSVSRMTVVVAGDDEQFKQIGNQLFKLIDVIKVIDHTRDDLVGRELALIKIRVENAQARAEIAQLAELFRANIVAVDLETMMLEVTGKADKVDAIQKMLEPYEILELVRTGLIVLTRGPKQT